MNLLTLVTAPATAPVTVADSKSDLRIQHSADDELIGDYISAATDYCQEVVGKKLVTQTWDYSIARADGNGRVFLPLIPAREIVSISYFDLDNILQVLDITDFYFYRFDDSAYIEPKPDVNWPSVFDRRDAITVQFIAGKNVVDIEQAIKRAIRLLVAHWYECRTAATIGVEVKNIPFGVDNLLGAHRVGWVA